MFFSEDDIDFGKLTDREFEELCFDLLLRLNFHSLIWREGGADSGRDIEATYTLTSPLIGSYDEKWFIECKRYTGGVPVEHISTKFDWADVEEPDHLVIFIASYLSNSARQWVEKKTHTRSYATHIIEGKKLKQLLIGFQDIIERYFVTKYYKLLGEVKRNWLDLNILPDPQTIHIINENIDYSKVPLNYAALLFCLWVTKADEMENWCDDNDEEFNSDRLISYLKEKAEASTPIFETMTRENTIVYTRISAGPIGLGDNRMVAHIAVVLENGKAPGLYCLVALNASEGLEVLIQADVEMKTSVSYAEIDVREMIKQAWIHLGKLP